MEMIYKYKLGIGLNMMVSAPTSFTPIEVGNQNGQLVVWAIVDTESEMGLHRFNIVGTGHALIPTIGVYLGTAQFAPFVWHVFYEGEISHPRLVRNLPSQGVC